MSEHSSADEEADVTSTFIHIRDEINSIHVETYNARKALIENLSTFTKWFEDIDSRLNRIEQLLLKRIAREEQDIKDEKPAEGKDVNVNGESNDKATEDDQTVHKKGGSTRVEQTRNETTTKTIANSKPKRAERERKPPKKWADESVAKESKKRNASETDEEEILAPEEKKSKKAKKAKKL